MNSISRRGQFPKWDLAMKGYQPSHLICASHGKEEISPHEMSNLLQAYYFNGHSQNFPLSADPCPQRINIPL